MKKTAQFLINENMRLKSRYFCLATHKVDYDILLLESKFSSLGRDVYHKSGICSVITEDAKYKDGC